MPSSLYPPLLSRLRQCSFWMRSLQLICLSICLISSDGVGPALCAFMADLDETHNVVVAAEPNGKALLTLKHERKHDHESPHSTLLETLCVLGRSSNNEAQDHILWFSPLDDTRQTVGRNFPPVSVNVLATPVIAPITFRLGFRKPQSKQSWIGVKQHRTALVMRC